MVDFGSKISSFVKNDTQNFVEKNVGKLASNLAGMGGGVINSLIGSVSSGLSQNLLDIGNSFNTIEAVAAQKMDGIVAGGEPEFAAGGKCADRSTKANISKQRLPFSGSLRRYRTDVFPDTVIEDVKSEWTESDQHVLTHESDKYYMKLRFYKYDRSNLFQAASNDSKLYSVYLPLPLELRENHSVNYDDVNLETTGNILNNMNSGVLDGSNKMQGSTAALLLQALKDGANSIKFDVAGISTTNAINAVEQYLGVAPNPNPSVMFRGPRLREFNFSWLFNPRNAEESIRLRKTIKKMQSSSLPATSFGTDTGLLSYPHILIPNFYPWDNTSNTDNGIYGWGEDTVLHIKRCVISNINTDYAPQGAPSFFAGTNAPTFIQLSIALKEIEFFVAGDIDPSNSNDKTEALGNAETAIKDSIVNFGKKAFDVDLGNIL